MEIIVYGPLRSATGQKRVQLDFDGETVQDALQTFVTAYPRAEQYLYDDDGELASSVRLSIEDDPVEPEDERESDMSLRIHPAMRGG